MYGGFELYFLDFEPDYLIWNLIGGFPNSRLRFQVLLVCFSGFQCLMSSSAMLTQLIYGFHFGRLAS